MEVGSLLYRVPREGFKKWSRSIFRDMFALPQADGQEEGLTDHAPIMLEGCTNEAFESLLEVMYPA